jgi:hypothetical protein
VQIEPLDVESAGLGGVSQFVSIDLTGVILFWVPTCLLFLSSSLPPPFISRA